MVSITGLTAEALYLPDASPHAGGPRPVQVPKSAYADVVNRSLRKGPGWSLQANGMSIDFSEISDKALKVACQRLEKAYPIPEYLSQLLVGDNSHKPEFAGIRAQMKKLCNRRWEYFVDQLNRLKKEYPLAPITDRLAEEERNLIRLLDNLEAYEKDASEDQFEEAMREIKARIGSSDREAAGPENTEHLPNETVEEPMIPNPLETRNLSLIPFLADPPATPEYQVDLEIIPGVVQPLSFHWVELDIKNREKPILLFLDTRSGVRNVEIRRVQENPLHWTIRGPGLAEPYMFASLGEVTYYQVGVMQIVLLIPFEGDVLE